MSGKILRVEFLGTLPELGKAMRIGRDCATIQIEVPQSEYERMLPLIQMREQVIRFSAEVDL